VIRFQLVADHKTEYSVKRMRIFLKLTPSSIYKWKATQTRRASRICAVGVLGARIAAVFAEEVGLYGANASELHSTTMSALRGAIIKGCPDHGKHETTWI